MFFILLNKHGLNPGVHVNIEQLNKFWDKDILGHTLVWFLYNFICVNPIFFCQYCINFKTQMYRDMLKKKKYKIDSILIKTLFFLNLCFKSSYFTYLKKRTLSLYYILKIVYKTLLWLNHCCTKRNSLKEYNHNCKIANFRVFEWIRCNRLFLNILTRLLVISQGNTNAI